MCLQLSLAEQKRFTLAIAFETAYVADQDVCLYGAEAEVVDTRFKLSVARETNSTDRDDIEGSLVNLAIDKECAGT